jgi:hypothetical protein
MALPPIVIDMATSLSIGALSSIAGVSSDRAR